MVKEGVNPETAAERTGHASVVIPLDTYTHFLPGQQDETALGFEKRLKRVAELQPV